LILGQ